MQVSQEAKTHSRLVTYRGVLLITQDARSLRANMPLWSYLPRLLDNWLGSFTLIFEKSTEGENAENVYKI